VRKRLPSMAEPTLDCLIIGGVPAGLTAAICHSRFHLKVRIVDSGLGRALWIPCTHNHAGYPGDISGADLLDRMREQSVLYGSAFTPARVSRLAVVKGPFEAKLGEDIVIAEPVGCRQAFKTGGPRYMMRS
jgi:thioredoxin reductase (NADPH)